MNKRGDIQVTILVFLVLILVISSAFIFYTSDSVQLDKFDLSIAGSAVSNSIGFENSLYYVFQEAEIKTFKEFLAGSSYDYLLGRKNTGEFSGLHTKLSENFAKRFKENVLEILSSQVFYDDSLKQQYTVIQAGNFKSIFDLDNITVDFNYVSSIANDEFANVEYSHPVKIKVPLSNSGLEGFNEIYLAKEKCKSLSDSSLKSCFEKELPNFEVEVYPVKEKAKDFGFIVTDVTSELYIVNLTSKLSFSGKQISFAFVPK